MLEVSQNAVAAGEEQLVSCAAQYGKYCYIFTVTIGPCGNLPFMSWSIGSGFAAALTQV
jgi:hypothetical protein